MDNNKQNFLDPNTLVAILLVGLIWFGWQWHLSQKYPHTTASVATAPNEKAQTPDEKSDAKETPTMGKPNATSANQSANQKTPENTINIDNANFGFMVSSHGMGIKNLTLKQFKDREDH